MKRHEPPQIVEIDADSPEVARALMLSQFGPSCAAWLMRDLDRRRKKAKRDFSTPFMCHVPKGVDRPMWFSLAVEYLRKRPSHWHVEERARDGQVTHYFTFIGNQMGPIRSRAIPLSIAPVTRGQA